MKHVPSHRGCRLLLAALTLCAQLAFAVPGRAGATGRCVPGRDHACCCEAPATDTAPTASRSCCGGEDRDPGPASPADREPCGCLRPAPAPVALPPIVPGAPHAAAPMRDLPPIGRPVPPVQRVFSRTTAPLSRAGPPVFARCCVYLI